MTTNTTSNTTPKTFASQADLTDKKITFEQLSAHCWAYTTEGDPNSGVIIGEKFIMVSDATATPAMAQDLIAKIRTVSDKPIKYVLLTHYHAVRVLGASAYAAEGATEIIASQGTYELIVERGAQDMQSEMERFPRLFRNSESVPGLTWPTMVIGVFCALDGLLFYVFFEATLIPMYLIIGIWGGPNKIYAAFKFFLYTLLGSLLLLIALIYLYTQSGGSFDIATWHAMPLSSTEQTFIFFAFFSAFAVKVPMWPVHTWLPDVHVEAPTGGSAVLAAIMLKLGAYGFLRFSMPIAPDAAREWAWLLIALSVVAVIYVGLVAMVQQDMKKLVAYSSVAHMGFVTLGFFIFNDLGVSGGLVQMIAHGFVSGAMFLCIGVLYDRVHSREIADYGGVVNTMPKFTAFALLFAMANCGLPGTAGFVGEWMVILGAIKANFWLGFAASTALIFGAAYTLWMFKRVYFGPVGNEHVKELTDINSREFLMLALLAIAVLYMGLYPKPFTDVMDTSVADLLKHVAQSKLN